VAPLDALLYDHALAQGGAGLGMLGLHERRLREYASVAGFGGVRLAFQDPFNKLYELRAVTHRRRWSNTS
jgi:hypothetical protein